MKTHSNLVAVEDEKQATGSIVLWQLRGDIDPERQQAAWIKEQLGTFLAPELPSPEVALRRAVQAQRSDSTIIRQHKQGWMVVREEKTEEAANYEVSCLVRLNKIGQVEFGGFVSSMSLPVEIKTAYHAALNTLTTEDVSSWLTSIVMPFLYAVPLRDKGGVYFVPAKEMVLFRRVANALESCSSHQIYEIPAMHTASAVSAILGAVTREAEKAIVEIESELDSKDLGERALRTRGRKAESALEIVQAYEGLLGESLETLQSKIGALKANIAAALLMIESE